MAGFFGMFDYAKPGKGVSKEDVEKSGIAFYFDILGRRIWKLFALNLIYVAMSIPAFVISWAVVAFVIVVLQNMTGISLDSGATGVLQLFLTMLYVLFCGSGAASVGMSYVLRKYVADTHSWVWSDFWDSFKINFLQGTLAYIINIVTVTLALISIMFYNFMLKSILAMFLSMVVFVIFVIFLMMQIYVYPIISGFKLKIKDVYRNALFLTLGKLPWNIVTMAVTILFICAFSFSIVTPLCVFIAILFFYSFITYTQIFMTNNIIRKYLQEPAEKAENEILPEEEENTDNPEEK